MLRSFIAPVFLLIFGCSANAGQITTQVLYNRCKSAQNSAEWAYCIGYLQAVAEQMTINGYLRHGSSPRKAESICAEDNVYSGISLDVFDSWVEKTKPKPEMPALLVVEEAFLDKWPCTYSQ